LSALEFDAAVVIAFAIVIICAVAGVTVAITMAISLVFLIAFSAFAFVRSDRSHERTRHFIPDGCHRRDEMVGVSSARDVEYVTDQEPRVGGVVGVGEAELIHRHPVLRGHSIRVVPDSDYVFTIRR
jgi:hypothetical protein